MATYTWNNTVNNRTWATTTNWNPNGTPGDSDDVQILLDIAATTTVVAASTIRAKSISIGDTSAVNAQWSLSAASQAQSASLTWVLPTAGGTIDVPNAGADSFGLSRSTVWINIGGGSAGGLIKTGVGTLSILGGNTFSFAGDFSINVGKVAIGTTTTVTMGSGTTLLANNVYLGGFGNVASVYASPVSVNAGASAFLFYNRDTVTSSTTFSGAISIPATSTLTAWHPSAGTVIISGIISGAGVLNNDGTSAGTLRLNAANTFTGLVRNTSGTLALNNTNAVQDATLDTDNLGGTVTFLNNSYIGGLAGNIAFTLPAGTTTIGGLSTGVTATYSGALGGTTQSLVKIGSGTQTLSGVSTRTTGDTTIAGGAIKLANGNGLYGSSGSGTTTVSDGGLWLSGNITTPAAAPLTLNGNGTGISSNLRNFSDSNIYAGTVRIDSTILGRRVYVYADASSTLTLSNTITLASTVNFSGAGTHAVSGVLASTGSVEKSDAGILTLSNSNTFTGALSVIGGTVNATTSATALGATNGGALSVSSSHTLSLGFAVSYGSRSLAISGTGTASTVGALVIANTGTNTFSGITLGAAAYIRATASGTLTGGILTDSATGKNLIAGAASGVTLTLSSAITGGGTLTVGNHSGDTGTVKLSASSTIGNTSIAYGTAQAGNTNAFGSTGTVTIASGTMLQTLTASSQNGKLTVASLNNAAGGTIKIGG